MEAFDSRTVSEWMAYHSIEPFGEERADLRAGIISSVIANRHRDPKREKEAYRPQDFMLFIEKPTAAQKLTESIKRGFSKFRHVKKRA